LIGDPFIGESTAQSENGSAAEGAAPAAVDSDVDADDTPAAPDVVFSTVCTTGAACVGALSCCCWFFLANLKPRTFSVTLAFLAAGSEEDEDASSDAASTMLAEVDLSNKRKS